MSNLEPNNEAPAMEIVGDDAAPLLPDLVPPANDPEVLRIDAGTGDDEMEGLLLQLMVRIDTMQSRLDQQEETNRAQDEALKLMSQSYEVVVSDLGEVEKIVNNVERAVGLAMKGADISGHIKAIREGLSRLYIFQPGRKLLKG